MAWVGEQILSSLARIDIAPRDAQKLVRQARAELLEHSHAGGLRADRAAVSHDAVKDLPVTLVAGGRKPFGTVLKDIEHATDPELLNELTPDNIYLLPPFRDLGNLPVSTSTDQYPAARLRDLFPPFGHETKGSTPVPGASEHSHTFHMKTSNSWWSTFFYAHFEASTSASVSGWDAADVLGGEYANAKYDCETIVVPPAGAPDRFILAFIKAAACNYAKSAPEVPFAAMRIRTFVCTCGAKGADGSCDPYRDVVGRGPVLKNDCSLNDRENVAGPVKATHRTYLGGCLGVTSRHIVDFVPDVFLVRDYC